MPLFRGVVLRQMVEFPEDVPHETFPCEVHEVCRVLSVGRDAEGESVSQRGPVRVGCVGSCEHTARESRYRLSLEFLKVVRAVPDLTVEARVQTEFTFGQVCQYLFYHDWAMCSYILYVCLGCCITFCLYSVAKGVLVGSSEHQSRLCEG